MPYLRHIVSEINSILEKDLLNDDCFGNRMVTSLCQSMTRTGESDDVQIFPSYVDEHGEGKYVGPDCDFDLIIYHRVNGITVGKAGNIRPFGDERQADANVARMSLVVFGDRRRLKLTNDELALLIQASFPDAASADLKKQLQFYAANINVGEIILNDLQVFREEFQGVPYFLKPDQFLFKVNYTIESAFLKGCFKKCNC